MFKNLIIVVLLMLIATPSFAAIKRIKGYTKKNGTYVSSHYRDTSNDGNRYNNANYLGYND